MAPIILKGKSSRWHRPAHYDSTQTRTPERAHAAENPLSDSRSIVLFFDSSTVTVANATARLAPSRPRRDPPADSFEANATDRRLAESNPRHTTLDVGEMLRIAKSIGWPICSLVKSHHDQNNHSVQFEPASLAALAGATKSRPEADAHLT
jgi:hypothetical protein